VVDLPAGPLNHHWTKNIIARRQQAVRHGRLEQQRRRKRLDKEAGRAAIWEVDRQTGQHRVFASGLRNPNGMAWEPTTRMLWTSVNERDEIGSDLVPDYITSVRDGGFYGWPFSYYGQHVDERVKPPRRHGAKAIVPDYAVGSHTASLGMTGASGNSLPARFTTACS
jgi:glucose/arabinose dehydrogenase